MATNLEIAGLLEESGWLRALAASLIGDGAQADDLVQDTWLAALRRPPRSAAEPRPWLARVVRNLARNARRDRARRQTREESLAEERVHPSADALVQQAEAQRLLAEAVTRLSEPLRAVIVLRFFQGLDSSAAAARLGLPASTVRTRQQRALEELRADLDRTFEGGRAGWGLVLAPLVRGGQGAPRAASAPAPTATAALSSWSPAVLAGAACVLATAGAIYLGVRHESGAREPALAALPSAVVEVRAQGAQESSGGRATIDPVPTRVPVSSSGTSATTGAALPSSEPASTVLAGTILVDGRAPEWPIELTLEPTVPPVLPGDTAPRRRLSRDRVTLGPEQQGRFSFALSPTWSGKLFVSEFPFANGEYSLAIDAPRTDLVLALHSGPAIVGRIVDPQGHGVPVDGKYQLRCRHAGQSASDIGTGSFACRADGRFRIRSTDRYELCSLTLRVEAEGYGFLHLDTPDFAPASGRDLGELELEALHVRAFTVHDPQGAPIEGAFARVDGIAWSRRSAETGPDGSGSLPFAPEREVDVRVSAAGFADRVVRVGGQDVLELVLEPLARLDLRLVGSLAGQAERVRLSAERAAFVWDEHGWDEEADLQAELGSIRPSVRRFAPGARFEYEFQHQFGGHYDLVGLLPDVPLTVEVLDATERTLALGTVSVASRARATLELGDPNSPASEPLRERMPMRRSPAPR